MPPPFTPPSASTEEGDKGNADKYEKVILNYLFPPCERGKGGDAAQRWEVK